jgi:hypothetical protein
VSPFGKKVSMEEQRERMNHFEYLPLWEKCQVDIKNPKNTFYIMEDFGYFGFNGAKDPPTKRIYFCLLVKTFLSLKVTRYLDYRRKC